MGRVPCVRCRPRTIAKFENENENDDDDDDDGRGEDVTKAETSETFCDKKRLANNNEGVNILLQGPSFRSAASMMESQRSR